MVCEAHEDVENERLYLKKVFIIFLQKCGPWTLVLGFVRPARPLKAYEFETIGPNSGSYIRQYYSPTKFHELHKTTVICYLLPWFVTAVKIDVFKSPLGSINTNINVCSLQTWIRYNCDCYNRIWLYLVFLTTFIIHFWKLSVSVFVCKTIS